MEILNSRHFQRVKRPVKVLQFGEGNFLRGFVDYMIDIANEKGVLNSNVNIVKPIDFGNLDRFKKQDNLYTLILRGRQNGEAIEQSRIISCVNDAIDPFVDYAAYEKQAQNDDLRFIVSNTTEAGIAFDEQDCFASTPPKTFPGKLTKLMYKRFAHYNGATDKGVVFMPCELIEKNGENLKRCMLAYAKLWNLGEDFQKWLEESCYYCNTLVDRIITGYPRDKAEEFWQKLGYEDDLLDTGEPFALWVIECTRGIDKIAAEFPLDKAGLPVVFTENLKPYRDRKVRILNGAHTCTVPAAFLAGQDIVRDCMHDEVIGSFMKQAIDDEIIPVLTLPEKELREFADSVIERFDNPFIDHQLLSICLNSVSKWKARVMPTVQEFIEKNGKLPQHLVFSLAALIAFYHKGKELKGKELIAERDGKAYAIVDDIEVLQFFAERVNASIDELAKDVLANKAFWGIDLTQYAGMLETVSGYLARIEKEGSYAVMQSLVKA